MKKITSVLCICITLFVCSCKEEVDGNYLFIKVADNSITVQDVDDFLNKGGDVNLSDKQGFSLYYYAIYVGRYDIATFLMKNGLDLKVMKKNQVMVFTFSGCDIELIEQTLKRGVDVNIRDKNDVTPLMAVIFASDNVEADEAIKLLLDNGADCNLKDIVGRSVLKYLAWQGNLKPETYDMIIKRVDDIDDTGKDGGTALFYAAAYNNDIFIKRLLASGRKFDINHTDNDNRTPLLYLSKKLFYAHDTNKEKDLSSYKDTIKLLLDNGADVTITDTSGKDIFDYLGSNPEMSNFVRQELKNRALDN